jgi:molecular chaperone GrpE
MGFGSIIAIIAKTGGLTCEEVMKKKDKEAKMDLNKENEAKSDEQSQDINSADQGQQEEKEAVEEPELSPEQKLLAEVAESKDKYLRLYSEFDNYRRRTSKEKLELMQTAGERIVVALLPVLDDFNRAEQALATGDAEATAEGVKLIADKFVKTLDAEGLKLMETKQGTKFDPEFHEAVTQIPAPTKKLKGKIVDTIERGYFLGEKVIRHAKVVIGA